MSLVLPVLFAFATVFAITAMWNAVASNIQGIGELRRRVALSDFGDEIIVTLRENEGGIDRVASMRRARHLRHPLPKPITHRLHQFVKARTAA